MSQRIGILVGGGDVPGLNICIKSLVYRLIDYGYEPFGIRKGWEGLINYNLQNPMTFGENFIELTKALVRPIDRTPGSFLHASRLNPRKTPRAQVPLFLRAEEAAEQDLTEQIKRSVDQLGFRGLVAIGDDDMLHYAAHLSQAGVPVIGIPKTIHNNIHGTEYSIGYSTGLTRGVAFIHELRPLAGSREQLMVVETYGMKSGLSSLMTSFLAGVDRAIIPEVPYDPERLAELVRQDKRRTPGNYAVITVSNGAQILPEKAAAYADLLPPQSLADPGPESHGGFNSLNAPGLVGGGMVAAQVLGKIMGEEVFLQSLSYLLRTGPPDGQDMFGATNFAILAARLVKEGKFGRMTSRQPQHRYSLTHVDLQVVTQGVNQVDVARMYDVDGYRPTIDVIWAAQEADGADS